MRVLDLFSGIGGFSLGLERAGMTTVAFCEIEPFCRAVLRKHWPHVPIYDDVRELTAARLRDDGISVDLICGGFPCQDISNAGKRAGIDGERSGLWSEYARIIGELRPRYVVVENVAALLGRGLERVLGDLAALGFDAEWHCIPASAVGAPHRRDRLWVVAYPIGQSVRGQQRAALAGEAREVQGEAWERERLRIDVGAARRGADVADADLARLEGWLGASLQERTSECAVRSGGSLPDADDESQHAIAVDAEMGRPSEPCRRTRWLVEPDVGRVAHGVPAELDGGRNGEEELTSEERAQGDRSDNSMSGMRSGGEVGTASPRLFATGIGRGLVSTLSHQSGSTGRDESEEGGAELRALREDVSAHAQQEACALQRGMSFDRWPHECGEAVGEVWRVEPAVGRVAQGVANRVDRLRGLGNAVVPQIPELIGRAILEAA